MGGDLGGDMGLTEGLTDLPFCSPDWRRLPQELKIRVRRLRKGSE